MKAISHSLSVAGPLPEKRAPGTGKGTDLSLPRTPPSEASRLRGAVQQLEGVFVEQLFKVMRETVPDGGVADGGAGEEIFSSLLDQHLAAEVPAAWGDKGLGEALYRQLSQKIQGAEPPSAPPARKA